jgi:hypothetical protein
VVILLPAEIAAPAKDDVVMVSLEESAKEKPRRISEASVTRSMRRLVVRFLVAFVMPIMVFIVVVIAGWPSSPPPPPSSPPLDRIDDE